MVVYIDPSLIWIVVLTFLVAAVLAFSIGANDVANSFGTSVGSKVLTLRQACILATVFETLGSVLLGAKVSDTIRKGVIDVDPYRGKNITLNSTINSTVNNTMTTPDEYQLLMVGQLSALFGSCVWLLVATFFRLPVSGTHSIVGATLGFALVAKGIRGVNWLKLAEIVASWFVSPVLSGAVSVGMFYIIKLLILEKVDPIEPGLRILPIVYGCTLVVNGFSVFYKGPALLKFDLIPIWGSFVASFGLGAVVCVLLKIFYVPFERRRIIKDVAQLRLEEEEAEEEEYAAEKQGLTRQDSNSCVKMVKNLEDAVEVKVLPDLVNVMKENPTPQTHQRLPPLPEASREELVQVDDLVEARAKIADRPEQAKLFSGLQILSAIFGSFAHGGNDVSNAIAPMIGVWIYATDRKIADKAETPMWILVYGGVWISVGLWVWGRRVIQTLGEDLTKITPSSGVCIELGAALTVLIASNVGLPISTTHCKVGSVVAVGRFRSRDNVDWSVFRNILIAWLVTLPASCGVSALFMFGLQYTLRS